MTILRRLVLVVGWLAALVGTAMVALYVMPEAQLTMQAFALASAFIPWGILAWLVAFVCFLIGFHRRGRLVALVPLIALVAQLGWAGPYWPHDPPAVSEEGTTPVRVFALNVLFGKADPVSTAAAVRATDPDVVILIEVSEPLLKAPAMADILSIYPHRVGQPSPGWVKTGREDARPTMVFSRHPLTELEKLPSITDQYVVRVEHGPSPLTLIAAHPMNMVPGTGVWEREGRVVQEAVARHSGGPLAVAGDLNATPEQVTLRRILDSSDLVLAGDEAGAGWVPTFDGGLAWLPPVIPIDHVLINDRVVATSYRVLPVERTDHQAVVADLVIR